MPVWNLVFAQTNWAGSPSECRWPPTLIQGNSLSPAIWDGTVSECLSLHQALSLSFLGGVQGSHQTQSHQTPMHATSCKSNHLIVACVRCFQTAAWALFRQLLANTADRHLNFIIPCCTGITQLHIWGHITLLLALQWLWSYLGKGGCCITTSISIRSVKKHHWDSLKSTKWWVKD